MKAVILKGTGDVDQLKVETISKPAIKSDQILLKTKAFSINPIETKTRRGNRFSDKLLKDKPSILGWDVSGVIDETGSDIKNFKPGDRVFGIVGFPNFGKTYADYVVAKEDDLCPIPEDISFEKAAVTNIAAITAYQALVHTAKIGKGTKVLIHAASGGVGHFAVQIAKKKGAEIYATASTEKRKFMENLGVDHYIDYKSQNFEEETQDLDVVFDMIGGNYIDRSLHCLKKGGMLISIPSATNAEVEEKAEAKGCTGVRFSMTADRKDLKALADMMESGQLKPFISERYTIDQIRDAHHSLDRGHTKGKIVVTTP